MPKELHGTAFRLDSISDNLIKVPGWDAVKVEQFCIYCRNRGKVSMGQRGEVIYNPHNLITQFEQQYRKC